MALTARILTVVYAGPGALAEVRVKTVGDDIIGAGFRVAEHG